MIPIVIEETDSYVNFQIENLIFGDSMNSFDKYRYTDIKINIINDKDSFWNTDIINEETGHQITKAHYLGTKEEYFIKLVTKK